MSDSSLSASFDAAIAFADFGAWMVIFGIGIEAIDLIVKCGENESFCSWFGHSGRFEEMNVKRLKLFSKIFHKWTLLIEVFSFSIVVLGLSIEVIGSGEAYRISARQNSVLNKGAADARKDAGEAFKLEAIANSRASEFDAARAKFENEAELTRSNNLVLQLQLQPRKITLVQITNFIFLTEKITNVPVKISFAAGRNETVNYAYQIREMFNRAGFFQETNAGIWGINQDSSISRRTSVRDTNWPSVYLYVYGTNDSFTVRNFTYESTNGFSRPIVNRNEPETVGSALLFALRQIGISVEEDSNSQYIGKIQ